MLLICGSEDFDFAALELVAVYEDGYTRDSQTIRDFWAVAHALTAEEKKKLLFFTTGESQLRAVEELQKQLLLLMNDC